MLEVRSIHAGYDQIPILRDVTLNVAKGEAVALVGPNGAGKTTLVRALCALNPLTSGRIVMNGIDISAGPPHKRSQYGISVVLENRRLFGALSVRDNLRLAERMRDTSRDGEDGFTWESVTHLFPIIDEKKDTAVELLSGGQQQMVAIARALLMRPDLLILDEPSTGLAPKVVEDILAIIGRLRGTGMAILIAEQDVRIATAIAERGYVLSLGRILHEIAGTEWKNVLEDERLTSAYLHGG